jgi:Uma2 family endonuclease
MATVLSLPEQRVVLRNASWQTYENLLSDCVNASAPRFTFDQGLLEIMSPSSEHEEYNRTLALLVEVLAEELRMDIRNLGSTTFKREDLQRGFEADSAFYIQTAERMSGRSHVDPAVDPPPDLVIEVDITSTALSKFPVYAHFGVPEIWRYDGKRVAIFKLTGGDYVESEASAAFPEVFNADLSHFLQQAKFLKRTAWLSVLRSWVRDKRNE